MGRQETPAEARHREAWEQLGRTDPMWAVLSDPAKRGGRWERDAFLATGEADVSRLMSVADRLGHPRERATALDFGTGVGRLSLALGSRFASVLGLDVSSSMIERARANGAGEASVRFEVGDATTLATLPPGSFDLIVSTWVLQHLPSEEHIRRSLAQLAYLLRPGGLLAIQVPGRIPVRHRLQPRRRLYSALGRVGVDPSTLLNRFRLSPIRMTGLAQVEVRRILEAAGLRILEVQADVIRGSSIDSFMYYATAGAEDEAVAAAIS